MTAWRQKYEELEARLNESRGDAIRRNDAHTRELVRLTDEATTWREHAQMLGRVLNKLT